MSARTVKASVPYVTWAFSEAEFKEKLGITDPEGVLQVQVGIRSGTISVTLAPASPVNRRIPAGVQAPLLDGGPLGAPGAGRRA